MPNPNAWSAAALRFAGVVGLLLAQGCAEGAVLSPQAFEGADATRDSGGRLESGSEVSRGGAAGSGSTDAALDGSGGLDGPGTMNESGGGEVSEAGAASGTGGARDGALGVPDVSLDAPVPDGDGAGPTDASGRDGDSDARDAQRDVGARDAPLATGLVVQYQGNAASLTFEVHVTNQGSQSIPTDTITIRYYLTNERPAALAPTDIIFDSAAWQSQRNPYNQPLVCAATYAAFNPPPQPTAQAYIDIKCTNTIGLVTGDVLDVRVRSAVAQNPTNDYSYLETPDSAAFYANSRIVLLQGTSVVAGIAP